MSSEMVKPRRTRRNKAALAAAVAAVKDVLVAYRRVSTTEQAESGAGLDAQQDPIERWAAAHGKTLIWIEDPGFSAGSMDRPGLQKALELVRTKQVGGIVVSKLDRLSRSMLDFCLLMEDSRANDWQIVALDFGLDTTTPAGELMVGILALFAQFERAMIKQRTKDGLAAKRAQGVRLGAPPAATAALIGQVWQVLHRYGTYSATARALNADGVSTATGRGRWHPDSVRKLLLSQDGAAQHPHGVTLPALPEMVGS